MNMDAEAVLIQLSALADKSRFTILQIMANGGIGTCCDRIEAYENGCCVADVVSVTGLSQPTVSHHLKVLEKAGLVRKELRGPWTCYFPNPEGLDQFIDALKAHLYPSVPTTDFKGGCCP